MSRRLPCCLLVALFWLALPLAAAAPPVGTYTPFGPGAGQFLSITADPSAPATLFGESSHGEVYKSTDGGQTWIRSGTGLQGPRSLGNLVADPGRPGVFYLLTAPLHGFFDQGLYRSVDGGATWVSLYTPVRFLLVPTADLWLVPGTPVTLLARDGHGALRAVPGSDPPVSWEPVDAAISPPFAVDPSRPGTVYGVSRTTLGGLAVSHDSGVTWTPFAGPGGDITALAVSGGALLAADAEVGLFVSVDLGVTWSPTGLAPVSALAAGPGLVVYAAAGGRFYASADGGHTFVQRSAGLPLRTIVQIAVSSSGRPHLLTRIGQVWDGTPGGGFRLAGQRGLLDASSLPLVIDTGDPSIFYLTPTIFLVPTSRSTDGGATWTPLSLHLGAIALDPAHPNRLLAIAPQGVVASADGGDTFGPPLLAGTFLSLARLPGGTLLAGGCGIERSQDGGRTWATVLPCSHGDLRDHVERLHTDPHEPATVYAEVMETNGLPGSSLPNARAAGVLSPLYRSRDGGRTWTRLAVQGSGLTLGGGRRTLLYLANDSGSLVSDNGGDSWRPLPVPDNFNTFFQFRTLLAADPTRGDGVYAMIYTEEGLTIVYSPDRGRNWKVVEAGGLERAYRGLPAWLVPDLRVPGLLYVGAQEGGVFTVQVQR
jgi:photosystem II stability/assembly factor-like uncharacterized protein